jgi:hypothetical protein
MFKNNGFDAISDLMLNEYWVGGTNFCALVNDLGDADLYDNRAVSSATAKGTTYLQETMKATSAGSCVVTRVTSSPTPSSSSGAHPKGTNRILVSLYVRFA